MEIRKTIIPTLALFGSFSTLICCALPALLVSLGAGAVMVGLVRAVPQLVWISKHKILLFSFAGIMLIISDISRYISRNAPCPIDPQQAKSCMRLRRFSFTILLVSIAIYITGFFFAFIAPLLF